ncbi:MAG: hypothetical protein LBR35_01550, partial [Rickettsiales bacterium]|nr:hypothetical protein [Rickettsiales bacterium]
MKKVLLTSLMAVCVASAANAAVNDADEYGVRSSVFNPAYRPLKGDVATQFGVMYQTGENKDATSGTDFSSGDVKVGDVRIAYGILDDLYVSLDVSNDTSFGPFSPSGSFANPEIGINWQVMRPAKSFALDLIAKYGIAWTEDALTKERIGMNNVQAGVRIYGDEGMFQWAAHAMGQAVFLPDNNEFSDNGTMWDVLMGVEAEFEIVNTVGLKAEFNYNIYNLNKKSGESMYYDPSVALGLIIDVTPAIAAIQPYVAYHFETTASGDEPNLGNDYFQVGVKFG